MGLVQDMAPAAKTLQEAHDASLLYDDDGDVPADNVSDSGEQEVDEPPSKWCKSYLGTHRSIPEAGQSTTDLKQGRFSCYRNDREGSHGPGDFWKNRERAQQHTRWWPKWVTLQEAERKHS